MLQDIHLFFFFFFGIQEEHEAIPLSSESEHRNHSCTMTKRNGLCICVFFVFSV